MFDLSPAKTVLKWAKQHEFEVREVLQPRAKAKELKEEPIAPAQMQHRFIASRATALNLAGFPAMGQVAVLLRFSMSARLPLELLQKPELGQLSLSLTNATEDHAIWHASLWPLMEADDEFIYYVGQNGQVVALSIEDEDEERYGVTVLAASIDAWIKEWARFKFCPLAQWLCRCG